jgi:hypothetical protein
MERPLILCSEINREAIVIIILQCTRRFLAEKRGHGIGTILHLTIPVRTNHLRLQIAQTTYDAIEEQRNDIICYILCSRQLVLYTPRFSFLEINFDFKF